MRKTKIVCTIGPACETEEMIVAMCRAGMNTARLNFSHGSHEEHCLRIERIKKVREELDMPIAIMQDTKGPEFRIKTFQGGKITLSEGDTFTFTSKDIQGSKNRVSVSFSGLASSLEIGDRILVNNGLLIFEVTRRMRSASFSRAESFPIARA
jgi:pyruvate kinase